MVTKPGLHPVLTAVLIWLSCSAVVGGQNSTPSTTTTQNATTEVQAQKQVGTDFSEEEQRRAWILFLRKLTDEEKKKGIEWQTLLGTISGALIAGLIGFLTMWFSAKQQEKRERERMRHEAELSKQKSEAEAQYKQQLARLEARTTYADKLLDLRLKQLELFIAPLHALLEQSRGVYEKLTTQLLEDKENYREVSDPESGKKLQVRWQNEWYDWRMLDQMPPLKGNSLYGPLISEIIRIGEEMTALIAKYSAFSLDESAVSDVYGEYLAHFGILRSIYKDSRTEPYPPGQHKIGYYPRRLNDIVKTRYLKLQEELRPYLEATNTLLEELKQRVS
jgi:hypothetical protein